MVSLLESFWKPRDEFCDIQQQNVDICEVAVLRGKSVHAHIIVISVG